MINRPPAGSSLAASFFVEVFTTVKASGSWRLNFSLVPLLASQARLQLLHVVGAYPLVWCSS